ncbi:MAG: ABC transporter ATP-binding protein [Spirochaetaceae bacterium]
MAQILLHADNLKKHYPVRRPSSLLAYDTLKAVDGVSFDLFAGETLSIVGESGCGKSTTRKLLLNVEPPTDGTVSYAGENVFAMGRRALVRYRRNVQMIYQDPYSSLDPKWKVGSLITEPLAVHRIGTRASRREKALELMALVGLRETAVDKFVHEFSGGQRQRIGIARALALDPRVIIADEPVSALDVSIQAQVVNLLLDLKERLGLTYVFISHDLSVVKYISDRVAVMYLGKIVETAPKRTFFDRPLHPYSKLLLKSVPVPDPDVPISASASGGEVPSPIDPPPGCPFHPRCPHAMEVCRRVEPPVYVPEAGREVKCHLYASEGDPEGGTQQ